MQDDTISTIEPCGNLKGLVGISPNGLLAFVGNLFPGKLSDRGIVQRSGLHSFLAKGYLVVANQKFSVWDGLEEVGIKLKVLCPDGGTSTITT